MSAPEHATPAHAVPELRMANQIAANFAHHPLDQAAGEVAAFLRASWTTAMLERLAGLVAEDRADVHPIVAAAVARLQASEQPA